MGNGTDLAGRTALATGASRSIGKAAALALAAAGAAVAVNHRESGRSAEEVADAIRAAGRRALVFAADVTDGAAVSAMVHAVEAGLARWTCSSTTPASLCAGISTP